MVSSELERRLSETLRGLPGASEEVETRARAAALDALAPRQAPTHLRRRLLTFVLAVLALFAVGAAALAAIGTIHVRLGETKKQLPAPHARLSLPAGAHGFAVLAGGKLAFVTRAGFRMEGLPVTAAAVSPRALYVAVGIGHSLVVLAPDGRQMWIRRTRGPVVAAAWAPSGLQISYVVSRPRRAAALRLIEGDGDHDRLVDPSVSRVTPAWRADSLALAYVGVGGRGVVYDIGHEVRRVVGTHHCGRVSKVAFAPSGSALALLTTRRVVLAHGNGGSARCIGDQGMSRLSDVAWISRSELVVSGVPARGRPSYVRRWLVRARTLEAAGTACTGRPVVALAAAPGGLGLAMARATAAGAFDVRLLAADSEWGKCPRMRTAAPLVRVAGPARLVRLAWR